MANDLHFAVCVGIDRYPGLPGKDLGSARRDAIAFRDWLIEPDGGGLPPDNVALVTAEPGDEFATAGEARPKQDEVNRALFQFNERLSRHIGINPEDWPRTRMYIYAAGHGIGPPTGEGAVLMADGQQGLWNSVELAGYANWYLHCGVVHEVVIFADCCREIVEGFPAPAAPPFSVCQVPTFRGTVRFIGFASRLGDVAWEPATPADRDGARGYFTAALVDGLNGAAADQTGEVTAASLAQYVQSAVEAATAGIGPYPQRGELIGDLATRLVFRAAGTGEVRPPQRQVRIAFPADFVGPVILRSGPGPADIRGRWVAADGEWRLALPDGFYQVVADEAGAPAFANQGLFPVTGSDVDVVL